MRVLHTIADLRQALAGTTGSALVPTMGNLHAGHLSLIERAKPAGGPVIVSIFVNRLQFAPHEDFDTYPRTFERDCELLRSVGCNFVFAPNEAELAEAVRLAPLPVLLKQRTQVLSKTNHKGVLVRERERLADEWRAFRRDNRHSDALSAHLPNASEPLIQQYFLEGVSGSLQVSGFISRDGKLFVARAAKKLLQRPRTLGISLCLEATELDPALAEKIKALCLEVGYFGVFGIEFLQVKGRPLLIDFNPRYYHFMALDIARGMPLPLLTALAALGEEERLADAVAQAQHDPKKVDAFTYAFQFRELLLAQTLTGTMKAAESLRWWRWYRAHRHSMVDAVRDDDDRRPALVDGAWSAAMRVRHPLTFVMRVALDR